MSSTWFRDRLAKSRGGACLKAKGMIRLRLAELRQREQRHRQELEERRGSWGEMGEGERGNGGVPAAPPGCRRKRIEAVGGRVGGCKAVGRAVPCRTGPDLELSHAAGEGGIDMDAWRVQSSLAVRQRFWQSWEGDLRAPAFAIQAML